MSRRPGGTAAVALLAAAIAVRAVRARGGAARVASLAVHRLRYGARRSGAQQQSRLYARGGHRLEAHLGRRDDGGCVVLALPVDGSAHSAVYVVAESRPWHDFERQAGLVGAAWGPCRSASAGL